MCSDEQHKQTLDALARIERATKKRTPDDQSIMVSDTQPWKLDYKGYRHVFMWLPAIALTMDFGEYGSGPVGIQQWFNLGMKPGYDVKTIGQATPTKIILRFTDESIP